MKFKTRYIFNNRKTGFAVDFGVCQFMYKNSNGSYVSDTCPGCYSARLLNVYPGVRNKLEALSVDLALLDDFKADISKIAAAGNRYIRFYSLADFGDPAEIEFIHAASEILPVEIFSKTLHTEFRHLLGDIVTAPGRVDVSLSLNKSWSEEYVEELFLYLIENDLATDCHLNYCFIGNEEVRPIPHVSVYHTTRKDKLHLIEAFGKNRVCCARDKDGVVITDKNTGNSKGSCAKCPLCKLPAADSDGNLLVKKRLEEVYAPN